jgi:tetratricopeptide (TPR) repeat protein
MPDQPPPSGVFPVAAPPPPPPPPPAPAARAPAAVRTTAAATPPPTPAPAGDGAEVRLFSAALRAWRVRDAGGALALLDQYQTDFPDGHFAHETLVIRVDALQALGRSREALAHLQVLPLDELPRAAELHLIRGELLVKAGRCQEALFDLERVLTRDRDDDVEARALYARASCRARLGDTLGAETDLRLYLLRHPQAPHAPDVRRALAR